MAGWLVGYSVGWLVGWKTGFGFPSSFGFLAEGPAWLAGESLVLAKGLWGFFE
jgi:hypothetical protein